MAAFVSASAFRTFSSSVSMAAASARSHALPTTKASISRRASVSCSRDIPPTISMPRMTSAATSGPRLEMNAPPAAPLRSCRSPLDSNDRSASRTACRLTWRDFASSRSFGSRSPQPQFAGAEPVENVLGNELERARELYRLVHGPMIVPIGSKRKRQIRWAANLASGSRPEV